MLGRWKRVREPKCRGIPGHGHPYDEELTRSERKVEVIRQEREVLKSRQLFLAKSQVNLWLAILVCTHFKGDALLHVPRPAQLRVVTAWCHFRCHSSSC
jgi:hypothetical protein